MGRREENIGGARNTKVSDLTATTESGKPIEMCPLTDSGSSDAQWRMWATVQED